MNINLNKKNQFKIFDNSHSIDFFPYSQELNVTVIMCFNNK
jgi:hypothetical protein